MTIKNKLKTAGAIALASLVGYMPLKAGTIYYNHSPALLNKLESTLIFDHNGREYTLTDENGDNKPDIAQIEKNGTIEAYFDNEDEVNQEFGDEYRNRRDNYIKNIVNEFKAIVSSKKAKDIKIKHKKFLLNKYGFTEVKVKGNNGRKYTVRDDKETRNSTDCFYVEGKKGYILYVHYDPQTQHLINDLVDFAKEQKMSKVRIK